MTGDYQDQVGLRFIATAHHLSDSVATVLLNLIKATGISGHHGIQHIHLFY